MCQSNSVGITTGDLDDLNGLEKVYKSWSWLVGVAFNISW